ncbi:MAG: HEAT repeat domain-containing protein [Cyanobacteria bacterium P01_F01_bin.53]
MSASAPDWSRYLESVCEDYAHWWEKYTLTDVTGRQQQAAGKSGGLLLDLMAETVPEQDEDDPQKDKQTEKIERLTVLEGLRKYAKEHVLLQGAPGSGKSTAMARLLLEEAEKAQQNILPNMLLAGSAITDKSVVVGEFNVPVLVELRYYKQSLMQLIEDTLLRHDPAFDTDTLDKWLTAGWLLLLMDGVNELPSESARQDVQRFRLRYEKTTPMVFTNRKLGEGGDLGIGKKLTMQPLSEAQMRDFVQAYLPGQGKAMLAQLGNRLREFGAVPLLLWMLCSVYASNQQQMPANLGEFFRWFTRLYDDKLKQDIQDESQSKRLWPEVLQELAYRMMVGRDPKESLVAIPRSEAEDIIRNFCQKAGEQGSLAQAKLWLEDLLKYHLIQLGSKDSIQFRHQLIQEYYAAENLLRQLPELSDEDLKWQYLNYLKWTEPLALMAGLVSEEDDALRLVQIGLEVDYELGAKLVGVIRASWQPQAKRIIDNLELRPTLKTVLLGKTQSTDVIPELLISLQGNDPETRQYAANALGEIGDASAIPWLSNALKDYESWSNRHRPIRNHAADALVKIGGSAAASALLTVFKENKSVPSSSNHIAPRKLAALSLAKIGNSTAISGLVDALQSIGNDARNDAVDALGEIGDISASPALADILQDEDPLVRRQAADALGKIGDISAVPWLLNTLRSNDSYVQDGAADALGKIGGASAISELLNALQDDDPYVRRRAVNALGYVADAPSTVVLELLNALQDNDLFVRGCAADALGDIGSSLAIPKLLSFLRDDDWQKRIIGANVLGAIGSQLAVSELLNTLQHDDWDVRSAVVNALGQIGDSAATPELLVILKSDDTDMCMYAADALGRIGDSAAVPGLLIAIHNDDLYMRMRAADALGKIGDSAAVETLLTALEDKSYRMRICIVNALGDIGDSSAVPSLLSVVDQDNDPNVRMRAADALGKIGNSTAVPLLLEILKSGASFLHWSVIKALSQIGDDLAVEGLIELLNKQSADTIEIFKALKQAQGLLGYYRPLSTSSITTREVFISYAWGGESETIANQLDQAFQTQGINIIRDKKDAGYKANIRDFMQQIGQGKCVFVVISDKYLKSENCMFELVEIANNGDFYDRIFPIVLSDANIYDAIGRLDYLDYWDNKKKTLQERMRNSSDFAKRGSINDSLDQYADIRDNIDQLADTLKNMNTLTPEMHRDSNFETVIEAVKAKLAE